MSIRFGLPFLSISWLSSVCLVRAWASKGKGGAGQGTRGAKTYAGQLLILCRRVGWLLYWGIKRQSVHYTAYQMVGVVSIVSCLSFVRLSASCLPCSLYVVRCAFKNKTVICSAKPKICTGVNGRFRLKWQGRKLWPLRNAWLIVKQNCIWKMAVRWMQDVRCMASISPNAEEKEYSCLLTMQLWFSKSNSVWP